MGKSPSIQSYFCVSNWNSPVLHPRHKLNYFKKAGWEDDWIETARDIVRTEFDQTYAFMDIDIPDSESETRSALVSIFFYVAAHV